MAKFVVNTQRHEPYKSYKFRLKWEGKYVAGFSNVSGLKHATEVVKHGLGGDSGSSHKSPGRTEYEAITLERGVTHDTAFEQWANKVWATGMSAGSKAPASELRKDIRLELMNEAGQVAMAYNIFRCWVSEWQAMPDLDANVNAVGIQHLKLENEGWERDVSVEEPSEQ